MFSLAYLNVMFYVKKTSVTYFGKTRFNGFLFLLNVEHYTRMVIQDAVKVT